MPLNFTQQERQNLLNHLRNGRGNAIGAVPLAQLMGFPTSRNQVRLRQLIKECIEIDNDLIGAATGKPNGFYLINDVTELDIYLDSLEERTRSANNRRNSLINSWNIINNPRTTRTQLNLA